MVMRRRRAWSDTRFAGIALVSGSTNKTDLLSGLSPTETKTVSRVLIDLWVYPPVTNGEADRSNSIDVAIGVVSLEAFNLETLPDANAVADYPQAGWVYVNTQPVLKYLHALGQSNEVIGAHFKADIRGQRKVDRGVLFMTILNIGVNGSDDVDIWGRVRALCLT